MREGRAILLAARVEFSATAGGIVGKGHVPCRRKRLVARAVELAAQAPGLGIVEPCSVILEVEDKPELEARVGDGEFDAVGAGLPDCFLESGMVSRPLDIEHAQESDSQARRVEQARSSACAVAPDDRTAPDQPDLSVAIRRDHKWRGRA